MRPQTINMHIVLATCGWQKQAVKHHRRKLIASSTLLQMGTFFSLFLSFSFCANSNHYSLPFYFSYIVWHSFFLPIFFNCCMDGYNIDIICQVNWPQLLQGLSLFVNVLLSVKCCLQQPDHRDTLTGEGNWFLGDLWSVKSPQAAN